MGYRDSSVVNGICSNSRCLRSVPGSSQSLLMQFVHVAGFGNWALLWAIKSMREPSVAVQSCNLSI